MRARAALFTCRGMPAPLALPGARAYRLRLHVVTRYPVPVKYRLRFLTIIAHGLHIALCKVVYVVSHVMSKELVMQTQVRNPTVFIMDDAPTGLTVRFCDKAIYNMQSQARFKTRADLDNYMQAHHPGAPIHRVH